MSEVRIDSKSFQSILKRFEAIKKFFFNSNIILKQSKRILSFLIKFLLKICFKTIQHIS